MTPLNSFPPPEGTAKLILPTVKCLAGAVKMPASGHQTDYGLPLRKRCSVCQHHAIYTREASGSTQPIVIDGQDQRRNARLPSAATKHCHSHPLSCTPAFDLSDKTRSHMSDITQWAKWTCWLRHTQSHTQVQEINYKQDCTFQLSVFTHYSISVSLSKTTLCDPTWVVT